MRKEGDRGDGRKGKPPQLGEEEREGSGEGHQDIGEEVKDRRGGPPQPGRVRPLEVHKDQ